MSKNNPFYYNLPTRPADFVGRRPLVAEIVADLIRPHADSWAVIGGRRFGKSSILKAIEFSLLGQLAKSEDGDRRPIPLIVDLKGSETGNQEDVYIRIVRLLYRSLRRNNILSPDLSSTKLADIANKHSGTLPFYQFEDTIDDLSFYFENQYGPLRLVLLLDELEAVTRFDWAETLFNQFRSLIYAGLLSNTVKLVLTGAANVTRVRHEGSPLLNAVKIAHIASISEFSLQTLFARGGEIPNEVGVAIQRQSGGHPFIAQYLLHHLWDKQAGLSKITVSQVEQTARQMKRRRSTDFDGWWDAIGGSGRLAYAILAQTADWVDEQSLIARVPHSEQPLTEGLSALSYHGLAVRDLDGQHYHYSGNLFYDWFTENEAKNMYALLNLNLTNNDSRSAQSLAAERGSLRRQLQNYNKSLNYLREQKAKYGLNVPIDILNGIDDAQTNIRRIEVRLRELEERD